MAALFQRPRYTQSIREASGTSAIRSAARD